MFNKGNSIIRTYISVLLSAFLGILLLSAALSLAFGAIGAMFGGSGGALIGMLLALGIVCTTALHYLPIALPLLIGITAIVIIMNHVNRSTKHPYDQTEIVYDQPVAHEKRVLEGTLS